MNTPEILIPTSFTNPIALLVLGMHRSGTSAFTRTANLLGADLPGNLMPASPGENEKGFWESLDVFQLNDEILASAGSHWDDCRPIDPEWFESNSAHAFVEPARHILAQNFNSSSLFVLKDPRMCRLLPFWDNIIRQMDFDLRCLIPVRNPVEVAGSLQRRNGFNLIRSLAIWLRHILDAEFYSRNRCRSFAAYDQLLNNWRQEVPRFTKHLGISWPRSLTEAEKDIDEFLDPRLRHHHIDSDQFSSIPEFADWFKSAYSALGLFLIDPHSPVAENQFDSLRQEFDRSIGLLNAISSDDAIQDRLLRAKFVDTDSHLKEVTDALATQTERLMGLHSSMHEREVTLDEITVSLADRNTRTDEILAMLEDRDRQLREIQNSLSERDARLTELMAELNARSTRLNDLDLALVERDALIAGLTSDLKDREAGLTEAGSELAQFYSLLAGTRDALVQRDMQLREITAAMSQRDARLAELNAAMVQRDARWTDITAALSQRDARLEEIRLVLAQREIHIKGLNDVLATMEKNFLLASASLAEREAYVRELSALLQERDTRTREIEALLADRESQLQELSAALADREGHLEWINAELSIRDALISDLRQQSEAHRLHGEKVVGQRNHLIHHLSRIIHSPSWQLSAPLQKLERKWPDLAESIANFGKLVRWGVSLELPERLLLRRQAMTILELNLFDPAWYIEQNPDIILQGLNPLMHWLVAGWKERRNPISLFDVTWYLQQRPDLLERGVNPLIHYLEEGAATNVNPHPLFDATWYCERYQDAAVSGTNPLAHYLSRHPRERRDPHPLFDANWYQEQAKEIDESGVNALHHYLVWGSARLLNPNPYFDSAWYQQHNPHLHQEGVNPLIHYLLIGAAEGQDPSPSFSTSWYLQQHPEILDSGMNPLIHYVVVGKVRGWLGHPLQERHASGVSSEADTASAVHNNLLSFPCSSPPLDEASPVFSPALEAQLIASIRASQEPGPYFQHENIIIPQANPVELIAFYLPQYHPIPENDINWGKGFTEWTNTSRAIPTFPGHYQPRLPGELGYYDLRDPAVQRRQMEMAKAHGISAFCYHHYWFSGKKLLRQPIDTHLANTDMDLPFCINWANEPWTLRWDGQPESGILVEQNHSAEDDIAFIRDLEPFLRDPRYLRVDGKPLLAVYRPTLFPDMKATIERWQNYCVDHGIGELFTAMVQSFEIDDPRPFGFDAAIEFPPHNIFREPWHPSTFFDGAIHPQVWNYRAMAQGSLDRPAPDYTWFRGLTLAWDNSPRKAHGWVFHNCEPDSYGRWLEGHCRYAIEQLPPSRRLVFINAWNEWAEGTYLEPDRHFGFAYLNRTAEILCKVASDTAHLSSSSRHCGHPAAALLDYLSCRHGSDARTWLVDHYSRFGLPATADETRLPDPSGVEVDDWLRWLSLQASAHRRLTSGEKPDVSILVPVHNHVRYTLSCLGSLLAHATRNSFEIIIGDDCSTDLTNKIGLLAIPGVHYHRHPTNLGFLENCNALALLAQGDYLVLLNNDTVPLPGWLDNLIDTLKTDACVGLVGSKLIYPDGRLQEAGSVIWDDASGWNWGNRQDPQDPEYNYRRDVDYCSGASIALRSSVWRDLGGFDSQRYQNAYYEDTDLAFRIRELKGLRVIYQPLSHLIHFEGVSSGRSLDSGIKQFQKSNQPLFAERWGHVIAGYGNPSALPDNFLNRRRGKKLLLIDVVTPLPDQDSGSVDTYNYLKIFCQLGFKVTLLPVNLNYLGPYVQCLQGLGVRVLHSPYVANFENALHEEVPRADIIFIYRETAHRYMWLLRSIAPNTPIVFNSVDLHFLRKEREAIITGTAEAQDEAKHTRRVELAAMALADVTIVLSQYEHDMLRLLSPDIRLACIPIVRDMPSRSDTTFEERRDVIFIGGFLHIPNVDAVKYFVSQIWPLVRELNLGRPCQFVVAGSNIPAEIYALAAPDIIIKGHVPDLGDLYDHALLSVAPLRFGAGLKGKVVSSLSYGVPVVGTSISMEGSGLQNEEHVLVADNPEEFAAAIERLHGDGDLWNRLAANGVEFALKEYSLVAVTAKLKALLIMLGVLDHESAQPKPH